MNLLFKSWKERTKSYSN